VDVQVVGESPWFADIKEMSLPIAHGEGRYYHNTQGLKELKQNNAIAVQYVQGEMSEFFSLESNPNGSLEGIAGVTAYGGRVLGMMPHPERAASFVQLPHWTYLKETRYANKTLPHVGPGVKIFKNAAKYFS
jgi:phosphoribosylformylglycinamidine synthase